jgi:TrmH family RNA methyltransferase
VYHTAVITSRQHPLVKAFRAAARGDDALALLDGWHLLHDAVHGGMGIEHVAVSAPVPPLYTDLFDRLRRAVHVVDVSASVMEAISPVRTPSGVAALATRPVVALPRVLAPPPALVLITIDVQDPGNAGTIVRSAEAAGATGVVAAGASADPWGWKALRASMGSIFRVPVVRIRETLDVCRTLREHQLQLVAAVPRGEASMYEAAFEQPTAILLGGEGAGLSDEIARLADRRISIPMQPPVESLNVAMSATVLAYEARRQRLTPQGTSVNARAR